MKPDAVCIQCPRRCKADRDFSPAGYCAQANTIRIARAAPHLWEEPFLSGKNGSGTIFFCGCNLRCCYCQNSPLLQPAVGVDVSPKQLAALMLHLQAQGVHNINLVTATHYTAQLVPILRALRSGLLQIPVVWNSSGYESVETLGLLDGLVDIYLPDFKYSSAKTAAAYSNAPDYPETALAAIGEMLRQRGNPRFDADGMMKSGVQVRHLVLPSHSLESRQALWLLHKTFGDDIGISIMNQYTPMPQMAAHPVLSRRVSEEEYDRVTRYALQIGMQHALIQEGEAASESFIPAFDLSSQTLDKFTKRFENSLAILGRI